jgi:hypothetical protein
VERLGEISRDHFNRALHLNLLVIVIGIPSPSEQPGSQFPKCRCLALQPVDLSVDGSRDGII